MIITVDNTNTSPRALDVENLDELKVVARGPRELAWLADAVASLGSVEGLENTLLDPSEIARLAGPGASEGWPLRFEGMLAYARGHGWTDDAGAVRAHVEWTD